MRQQLYLEDSYCKEHTSKVTAVSDKGIRLEQVIFYPRGGGQPADRGEVVIAGQPYKVEGIKSTRDGTYIRLEEGAPEVSPGDELHQRIDWGYRYQLMQHHTILHLLSAVVWDRFEAKVTGGTIYPDRARLDFDLDEFGSELAHELVDRLNEVIAQHHKVSISFVDRETAEADPELIRTKVNLLPGFIKEIRLVKIGDVDIQADGGLHVNSTDELGRVELVKSENKGKGRKRITVAMVA